MMKNIRESEGGNKEDNKIDTRENNKTEIKENNRMGKNIEIKEIKQRKILLT